MSWLDIKVKCTRKIFVRECRGTSSVLWTTKVLLTKLYTSLEILFVPNLWNGHLNAAAVQDLILLWSIVCDMVLLTVVCPST